jgi:clan AA aspartic protease (TIGR02281 family)
MQVSARALIVAVGVALILGAGAGWWYRGVTLPAKPAPLRLIAGAPDLPSTGPVQRSSAIAHTAPVQQEVDKKRIFSQMLAERRFREATAFYYRAIQADAASELELRPTLDAYLQNCFQHCETATFLDLVDAWLATFYDDMPVLLSFAEYQERQGQAEAAANTLLLAKTYAFPAGDQAAVQQARDRLTERTDKRLDGEQRWVELLGYYEFLAAIDFTIPEFELRQALLYRRLGEDARANELLTRLQSADDRSDPQWTATIDSHVAERASEQSPGIELSNAIPLERHGSGYLVNITLNDRDTLKLLVDTGASMTALTRESFRQLHQQDFSLQRTQLFNTANGYARGDVYRASTLTLGDERVEEINVAVLDLLSMGDVDGLLGMNVLRQFRFELDQSAGVMFVERR